MSSARSRLNEPGPTKLAAPSVRVAAPSTGGRHADEEPETDADLVALADTRSPVTSALHKLTRLELTPAKARVGAGLRLPKEEAVQSQRLVKEVGGSVVIR
jgi:hypothetical protein